MGFKFRKSIKILPGVKVNITNKGINSASIGKQGASINIGKKGIRTSVGIPGSGLSYSKYNSYDDKKTKKQNSVPQSLSNIENTKSNVWLWILCGFFCFIIGAIIF